MPISESLYTVLDLWGQYIGGQGLIVRSVDARDQIGDSLSTAAVFKIVRGRGALIGRPELAPHDLRRTFANIALRDHQFPLTELRHLLGHESVKTTEAYLNPDVDLNVTASDFIPMG